MYYISLIWNTYSIFCLKEINLVLLLPYYQGRAKKVPNITNGPKRLRIVNRGSDSKKKSSLLHLRKEETWVHSSHENGTQTSRSPRSKIISMNFRTGCEKSVAVGWLNFIIRTKILTQVLTCKFYYLAPYKLSCLAQSLSIDKCTLFCIVHFN